MNFYEPGKEIKQMQVEADSCNRSRFLEIIQAHRAYKDLIKDIKSEEAESWQIQSQWWLECLSEISLERFGEDLLLDQFEITISYSKDITRGFKSKVIKWINFENLVRSEYNYTNGVFFDGYRDKKHWQYAGNVLFLDIDGGFTIEEAKVFLQQKNLKAIIATSKSHQKWKGELPPTDRFRVAIALNATITTTIEVYENAVKYLQEEFFMGKPDKACKDVSRFYYPSKEATVLYIEGFPLDFRLLIQKKEKENKNYNEKSTANNETVLNYTRNNYSPGNRNNILFQSGKWLKDLNYSPSEVENILKEASSSNPLDEKEFSCILKSVFK